MQVGTKFWMAPEVLSWGTSSFDSDMFSLHVVMWEVRGRSGRFAMSLIGVWCLTYFSWSSSA